MNNEPLSKEEETLIRVWKVYKESNNTKYYDLDKHGKNCTITQNFIPLYGEVSIENCTRELIDFFKEGYYDNETFVLEFDGEELRGRLFDFNIESEMGELNFQAKFR